MRPSTNFLTLFLQVCGNNNMAKSLQEQLLAAGLVDKKKAKKAAKEMKVQDHLQRTGQENQLDAVKAKAEQALREKTARDREDRKSTRLNSSHVRISYAVFC